MGRPLKIAKAQAVLTITNTNSNGTVTVTDNLTTAPTVGVMAGMPFVPATSLGGLVANTTYYILAITGNHTFTVSSTQLSVQPQVSPSLSTASGTCKASVAVVDAWFNNPVGGAGFPSTNANTYGVVGGNTAIVGKQVLCNVAFGVQGTGTVFASTGSNIVAGLGTDFANIATGTHIYAQWGNDPTVAMLLGTASSTHGAHNVAVANTNNTGNIIRTSGNAQTLLSNGPVKFSSSLGGLIAGTQYFVLNIANSSAFTVSLTPGGAQVDLSDATGTPNATQDQVILGAASANNAAGTDGYGDGFATALPEAGYIVRQKGKTKYLVTGTVTGITSPVYTANVANTGLTPNTMTIIGTYAGPSTKYMRTVNDYQSEAFPTQVASGSLVAGTVYTIYTTGTTNWTSVGAASNITGVTFTATGTAAGTGYAIASNANPDVISTFNTAYAANTYPGQPNPIVTIAGV